MDNKIKNAFDCIKADETTKVNTINFINSKIQASTTKKSSFKKPFRALAIAVVFFLIIISGTIYYYQPAYGITIDLDDPISLEINGFNRVVNFSCPNKLQNQLKLSNIKHMHYQEAMSFILSAMSAEANTNGEEILVSVTGDNSDNNLKISEEITASLSNYNISCHEGTRNEAELARSLGISTGKYKAFLELSPLNPSITVEDIKGLTMRQIYELFNTVTSPQNSENINNKTEINNKNEVNINNENDNNINTNNQPSPNNGNGINSNTNNQPSPNNGNGNGKGNDNKGSGNGRHN